MLVQNTRANPVRVRDGAKEFVLQPGEGRSVSASVVELREITPMQDINEFLNEHQSGSDGSSQ